MKPILYGIGVGPGDPELLTIKALRLIKECDVIVVPGTEVANSVAYKIVKGAYAKIDEKQLLAINMPMTKEKEKLKSSHQHAMNTLMDLLDKGNQVAFLTLGDPTIYSTYMYLHAGIKKAGYETKIISGVTSFCAVAAALDISLVEKSQMLHVIPATYGVKEAMPYTGTKVFMKSGKKAKDLLHELKRTKQSVKMVENCGMPNEKIYENLEEIPEECSYYSLFVVKEELE